MRWNIQGVAGNILGFDDTVDGNPSGGEVFGKGIEIQWQEGPLGRGEERQGANGAFMEDLLLIAKQRLLFYQDSPFACEANAESIRGIDIALEAQRQRTADRESRDVEGTHAV